MKTQSIIVAGRSFKIKSDADQSYLQSLADTISKKFESMSRAPGGQDQDLQVMAMIAIGLLDELNLTDKRCQDIVEQARAFSQKMVARIDELLADKSM